MNDLTPDSPITTGPRPSPADPHKVIIVIPVYNHSITLRDVVKKALDVHDTVMVVDDGSTDRGVDKLEGLDVKIIRHAGNLGKGAAILSAIKEARTLGMTHVVTIDADGQHDPNDFHRFIRVIRENPDAIVVGKRDFKKADVPFGSRIGRGISNFWLRVETGRILGDAQSGFRAYPVSVIENLKLREKRYALEIEVLVKAAWAGVELLEVDISTYYPPPEERISHFRLFRDNLRLSLLNARLTMRSVAPVPHRKIVNNRHRQGEKITVLHPLRSLKKLLTENTSPAQLAAASALGVFLGTLPLIACHSIVILFAAAFFRLNKVVALSASQICMPPLVPALCIETGYFLRHGKFLTEISMTTLGYQALERLYEWVIGSLLLAPLIAVLVGLTVYVICVYISIKRKNLGY
ncbi:MAG: DUF2062 domain-containing protein [Deltaproteobacteria bacterium]|nr:DUF2062 domain-containing protein [Deltaproteobacteria bacterium]